MNSDLCNLISLADAAREPFIGLTREDFPDYNELLNCENNSLQNDGLSLVSRNHRLFGRAKHSLRDKERDEQ